MTDPDVEYVNTIHPMNGREEFRMKTVLYSAVKNFMLDLLQRDQKLYYSEFLEKVSQYFSHDLGQSTTWVAYRVKLDLEARGLIRHVNVKKRNRRESVIELVTVPRSPSRSSKRAMGHK